MSREGGPRARVPPQLSHGSDTKSSFSAATLSVPALHAYREDRGTGIRVECENGNVDVNAKRKSKGNESDALEALNAAMRLKGRGPKLIRRSMEAELEAKAKKRRSSETAASSGWKRG